MVFPVPGEPQTITFLVAGLFAEKYFLTDFRFIITKKIVKTPYSFVELTARVRCLYLQTQIITSDVVFNVDICRTGDHSQGSGQSRPW